MNCARTFSILLSVPESYRVNIDHHHRLVDMLAPPINGIPVNPSDFSFGAARALRLRVFTFESWRQPRWWFRLGRKVAGQQVRKRLRV